MTVRDASELLYPAVVETVAELGLLGQDSAARKLAERYARVIDQALDLGPKVYASQLRWLGPELLKVLAELGATPAARAALMKGQKGTQGKDKPKTQLEILREQRARGGRGRA